MGGEFVFSKLDFMFQGDLRQREDLGYLHIFIKKGGKFVLVQSRPMLRTVEIMAEPKIWP